jgi:hypothetical protein
MFILNRLTVCVTCVWAGVDNAWEQEKLEARKMLENAAESHTSGARFVGRFLFAQDSFLEKRFCRKTDVIISQYLNFDNKKYT